MSGKPQINGSIWPGKLRAVAVHLGFSLIAFGVVLYLILTAWYPGFHFSVDGGWQGVRILIFVDLVLGPALTALIFDLRKTRAAIIFDLCVIFIVQVGALAWGVMAIHSQRLAGMGYRHFAIYPVFAEDIYEQGETPAVMTAMSQERPPLVFVARPKLGSEALGKTLDLARLPLESHVHNFRPWRDNFERAVEDGQFDADAASADFPEFGRSWKAFLDARGLSADEVRVFIYYGRFGRRMLAFDAGGKLLGALPYFNPAEANEGPPIEEEEK